MGKKIAEGTIKKKNDKVKNLNITIRKNNIKDNKNFEDVETYTLEFDQIIEPSMRPRSSKVSNTTYDPLKNYKKIIKEKIERILYEQDNHPNIGEDYYIEVTTVLEHVPPKHFTTKQKLAAFDHKLMYNKKPDIDNIAKTIYDSVEGIFFFNDSQIVKEDFEKYYGPKDKLTVTFHIKKQPDIHGRATKEEEELLKHKYNIRKDAK